MKRAAYSVTVAGTNISTALAPLLIDLSVTDKAGTNSDTASINVDDSGGQIVFPQAGAAVEIALGWQGGSVRSVFTGTVDEVKSSGSRGGGRTLSISAKGVDTNSPAKQGQQRHFDDKTVSAILQEAAETAGLSQIDVDPSLASITIPYLDMRGESFLHMGERLARMVGGRFRVQGDRVIFSKRGAVYEAAVRAVWGDNLHSWSMAPTIGRGRYKAASAAAYDPKAAALKYAEAATGTSGAVSYFVRRELEADEDAAQRRADADAATAQETAGGGTVVIEGNPDAVPDGLCILSGARPGIDGTYRIKTVTHSYSRGGGFVTSLEVVQPQGSAGSDSRGSSSTTEASTEAASDEYTIPFAGPQ